MGHLNVGVLGKLKVENIQIGNIHGLYNAPNESDLAGQQERERRYVKKFVLISTGLNIIN